MNDEKVCPKCNGLMWDNRAKKASGEFKSNSPDYACRDKECGNAIWDKETTTQENINKPGGQAAEAMTTPRAKKAVDWDKKDEFHARQTAANVGANILAAMIQIGTYEPREPQQAVDDLKAVIDDLTTKIHTGK